MLIRDLNAADVDEVAALLHAAFAEGWPDAWPTLEAARAEVMESLDEGRISRVAIDGIPRDPRARIVGWIGGQPGWTEHLWELHPLAVRRDAQGRGVGTALVADLEAIVRERGGLTMFLGSDDETGMTSLAGVDLYPDPWPHIAAITNRRGHPFEFYRKCGYTIVGVLPDVNGPGKPDILMAKRLRA